jgi:hypothetical protein
MKGKRQLTKEKTPWSRFLAEELIVAVLFKKCMRMLASVLSHM